MRFDSIIGQKYATDSIYAHLQGHIESYEASRHSHSNDPGSPLGQTHQHKPLVLSFHGPTGTGKSLTANSIAMALFYNPRSTHIHTYHGSDFAGTSPEQVSESIQFLKAEFISHVRRCPLSLFIIEEIHLMASGVLDGLRHLMDAQALNSKFQLKDGDMNGKGKKVSSSASTRGVKGGDSPSPSRESSSSHPTSITLNFGHVIWLFTTNIGSHQVQELAYESAKAGRSRDTLSPTMLHEMLVKSLEHAAQLQVLRDASVLSALIPFFPLFKSHVKECATVQLSYRKKYWLQNRQLASFDWDASVPAYTASQLKYRGPISIYGCKNVYEILTSTLLSPLTREFRKIQEESDHELADTLRDARVSATKKIWQYGLNLMGRAKQLFTGTIWNLSHTNVTMRVDVLPTNGNEEVVFTLATPTPTTAKSPTAHMKGGQHPPQAEVSIREIRRLLHTPSIVASEEESTQTRNRNKQQQHMLDNDDEASLQQANAETRKEEL